MKEGLRNVLPFKSQVWKHLLNHGNISLWIFCSLFLQIKTLKTNRQTIVKADIYWNIEVLLKV